MKITNYNAICNLGAGIDEVFKNAIAGVSDCFIISPHYITGKNVRLGTVNAVLPTISTEDYNTRCNKLALACIEPFAIDKYDKKTLAVVCATTNTGVEEYEYSGNYKHAQIGNLAEFIAKKFNLKNYYTTVSTACSSGLKAFLIAKNLLDSGYSKQVLVIGADAITKFPIYGFDSLEVLSPKPTNPFSKNRCGINIGEGAGAFVLENAEHGIEIAGMGETTDCYHATTPDPSGIEAERAIRLAIGDKKPDYINLHGTGTLSNDLMEGRAVYNVFKDDILASSTKPLTGHCLGAAASIETALCCKLLDSRQNKVFPHVYDGEYDENIPKINLAGMNNNNKNIIKTCLCLSFGFGGTNCAINLRC